MLTREELLNLYKKFKKSTSLHQKYYYAHYIFNNKLLLDNKNPADQPILDTVGDFISKVIRNDQDGLIPFRVESQMGIISSVFSLVKKNNSTDKEQLPAITSRSESMLIRELLGFEAVLLEDLSIIGIITTLEKRYISSPELQENLIDLGGSDDSHRLWRVDYLAAIISHGEFSLLKTLVITDQDDILLIYILVVYYNTFYFTHISSEDRHCEERSDVAIQDSTSRRVSSVYSYNIGNIDSIVKLFNFAFYLSANYTNKVLDIIWYKLSLFFWYVATSSRYQTSGLDKILFFKYLSYYCCSQSGFKDTPHQIILDEFLKGQLSLGVSASKYIWFLVAILQLDSKAIYSQNKDNPSFDFLQYLKTQWKFYLSSQQVPVLITKLCESIGRLSSTESCFRLQVLQDADLITKLRDQLKDSEAIRERTQTEYEGRLLVLIRDVDTFQSRVALMASELSLAQAQNSLFKHSFARTQKFYDDVVTILENNLEKLSTNLELSALSLGFVKYHVQLQNLLAASSVVCSDQTKQEQLIRFYRNINIILEKTISLLINEFQCELTNELTKNTTVDKTGLTKISTYQNKILCLNKIKYALLPGNSPDNDSYVELTMVIINQLLQVIDGLSNISCSQSICTLYQQLLQVLVASDNSSYKLSDKLKPDIASPARAAL